MRIRNNMNNILGKLNTIPLLLEERSQLRKGLMYVKSYEDGKRRIRFLEETIIGLLKECSEDMKNLRVELARQSRKLCRLENNSKFNRGYIS